MSETSASSPGQDPLIGPDGQMSKSWANFLQKVASTVNGVAHLDSPQFINAPTAPTPPANDNSTKIATTAYVRAPGNIAPVNVAASGTMSVAGVFTQGGLSTDGSGNLTIPELLITGGPNPVVFTAGVGDPTSSTPGYGVSGSVRIRTDGASGSRIYISQGSGWTAISGV